MILITGDYKQNSAQGVRFEALFEHAARSLTRVLVTFSCRSDSIAGWKRVNVSKAKSTRLKSTVNSLLRRLVFPDPYFFRLGSYKAALRSFIAVSERQTVIIGCTPFSLLLLGPWIKKMNPTSRLIADLSDPFSFNMANYKCPLQKLVASYIENKTLPSFEIIVVLNEGIKNKYIEIYPELAEKFLVVEQGVDLNFINSVQNNSKTKITNSWSFVYAGSFYKCGRTPSHLYQAFQSSSLDVNLKIYGNLRLSMRPFGSSKISLYKAVPKNELVRVTADADALILFDNEYGYQVPGKTLETLAINKPVLFIYNNEKSPTLDYVREATGVVWAKNNADDISRGIERIVSGDYEPRCFDYSPYTWDKMREKYQLLLSRSL